MKKDVAEFVSQCPNCQQVKVEHQKPARLVQEIAIPLWKWEAINMDFITGLPRSCRKFDSIWVIVERLTKSTHFLPVRATFTSEDYAGFYIREIVRVNLSTTFHPQTDGQAKRTILTLENMLRVCALDFKGKSGLIGPNLVQQTMEQVKLIRERLLTTQSRQKSYLNVRRRDLEFCVDDWAFLKVSPMKGVMRFGKKGKLSPRFIGSYQILRRVEDVQITEDLSYEETPVAILDRQVHKLRTKEGASVKVLWRNKNREKVTWEAEDDMRSKYPHLFHTVG
ncbi:hypothetical protein MTR67_023084 [Solanum verrucosum]|uniref:Tf2-1-like SH3-like domain-containing protein n=1 Tax=Solanum verrucosum TaxID=315347 RepID=A0AAF0QSU4_SOLVR|nr:hypothetical protein MTR67_023084 [Solanum verrucosum]